MLYRDGILFTSGKHKGNAFFTLLETLRISPKRILFINDKHPHLTKIEETAKEKNVPFVGLRYSF